MASELFRDNDLPLLSLPVPFLPFSLLSFQFLKQSFPSLSPFYQTFSFPWQMLSNMCNILSWFTERLYFSNLWTMIINIVKTSIFRKYPVSRNSLKWMVFKLFQERKERRHLLQNWTDQKTNNSPLKISQKRQR